MLSSLNSKSIPEHSRNGLDDLLLKYQPIVDCKCNSVLFLIIGQQTHKRTQLLWKEDEEDRGTTCGAFVQAYTIPWNSWLPEVWRLNSQFRSLIWHKDMCEVKKWITVNNKPFVWVFSQHFTCLLQGFPKILDDLCRFMTTTFRKVTRGINNVFFMQCLTGVIKCCHVVSSHLRCIPSECHHRKLWLFITISVFIKVFLI